MGLVALVLGDSLWQVLADFRQSVDSFLCDENISLAFRGCPALLYYCIVDSGLFCMLARHTVCHTPHVSLRWSGLLCRNVQDD